ncbi:MAG: Crp/Fnr family transcriptional regulator [Flavobacterium sp.]
MESLRIFTNQFVQLSDEEFDLLAALFEPIEIKKLDHLLVNGTYVRDIYFVEDGLLRVYCLKDGEEFTTKFIKSLDCYAELFSIRTSSPTLFNIQALRDTICHKANFQKLELLTEKFPNHKKIFFKLYEHIYLKGSARQVSFIYDSQQERYEKLVAEFPDMLEQIPLQHIASFLGIKPETLSRIRKKVRQG